MGELYGLPRVATLPIAAVALLAVVLTGSYRRVERVAIAVGLFELAFFFVAFAAHPDPARNAGRGRSTFPYANKDYLYLAAANIGAVIMPWMIFYQQSAIADKRLRPEHLAAARWDTAIGAVITQLVMAAVLIACAATIGRGNPNASLTVGRRHEPGADAVPRHRHGQPGVRPGRAGRRHGGGDRLFAGLRLGPGRGRPAIAARWNTARWRRAGSTASTPSAWSPARWWWRCGRTWCR